MKKDTNAQQTQNFTNKRKKQAGRNKKNQDRFQQARISATS